MTVHVLESDVYMYIIILHVCVFLYVHSYTCIYM